VIRVSNAVIPRSRPDARKAVEAVFNRHGFKHLNHMVLQGDDSQLKVALSKTVSTASAKIIQAGELLELPNIPFN
jgi:hypothetical protein